MLKLLYYQDTAGRYRLRIRAENGQKVAKWTRSYSTPQKLRAAIRDVIDLIARVGIAHESRRDAADQWRWRLRALGRRGAFVGGEAYHNRADANTTGSRVTAEIAEALAADGIKKDLRP